MAELETRHREIEAFVGATRSSRPRRRRKPRQLALSIRSGETRVATLTEKVTTQERLVTQGLLTRQALLTTQQEVETAREQVRADRHALAELDVQSLQARNQAQEQLAASRNQINEARRDVARLEGDLGQQGEVTSAYSGRVLEVMAEQGGLVERGQPVLTVSWPARGETWSGGLRPRRHGRRSAGMAPDRPLHRLQEEYGYLFARDLRLHFPATPQGMQRV